MKILIIEDEPKTGEYLRQGLKEASFTVDLAQNGNDGLHTALEGEYDLVILDVMLPEMDGFEMMEIINKENLSPNSTKIFFSNKSQQSDVERGTELGAVGFITKSNFTPAEVIEQVVKILEQKNQK